MYCNPFSWGVVVWGKLLRTQFFGPHDVDISQKKTDRFHVTCPARDAAEVVNH